MPPVLCRVWSTRPLPDGTARLRALAVLAAQGVRAKDVLVWRTRHTIANAAVIGVLAPLRYVLISDLLLARLSPPELDAVLAHEAAHIRRRHLPWLVAALLGAMLLVGPPATLAGEVGALALAFLGMPSGSAFAAVFAGLVAIAATLAPAIAFSSWVSRVFERQADAAAVVAAARVHRAQADTINAPGGSTITTAAVLPMESALVRVAALVGLPIRRFTLRHGSIAQRVRSIRSLANHPLHVRTAPDRAAAWAKLSTLAVLGLGLLATITDAWLRGLVANWAVGG
jgi:Zn-dependent protease with chaperone function